MEVKYPPYKTLFITVVPFLYTYLQKRACHQPRGAVIEHSVCAALVFSMILMTYVWGEKSCSKLSKCN